MSATPYPLHSLLRAVARARYAILSVAATYLLFIGVGIVMAHTGNRLALEQRDRIVGSAHRHDPSALADDRGDPLTAALLDASRNLLLGAVPKTVAGLAVVMPYPMVAYQGWVGGIVSIRDDHKSRLTAWRPALYYLITLLLQVLPYSLAVGGGVNAGVGVLRPASHYQGAQWIGWLPKEAARDLLRLYLLAVPLFFIASLWEFLSPWG